MIFPTSSFRSVYNPTFFKKKKNIFLSKTGGKTQQRRVQKRNLLLNITHLCDVYMKHCVLQKKNSPCVLGKARCYIVVDVIFLVFILYWNKPVPMALMALRHTGRHCLWYCCGGNTFLQSAYLMASRCRCAHSISEQHIVYRLCLCRSIPFIYKENSQTQTNSLYALQMVCKTTTRTSLVWGTTHQSFH